MPSAGSNPEGELMVCQVGHRARLLSRCLLLAALAATPAGCTRFGFGDQPEGPRPDSAADGARPGDGPADGRGDGAAPADLIDGPLADRRAEAPFPDGPLPQPQLVCAAPQLTRASAVAVQEPALRLDGLTLWATRESAKYASRGALDQPFGSWTAWPEPEFKGQDLYFFADASGQERLLVAVSLTSTLREFQLCTVDFSSCSSLSLQDELTGLPITDDVDGPSVVSWAGSLHMVFNVQPGAEETARIWIGQPSSADLRQWRAAPVLELDAPGVKEDDPTISADGKVLVYSMGSAGASDLMVATRRSVSEPFSAPQLLVELNAAGGDAGPLLYELPDGQYELFFYSNRSGLSQIYHALCAIDP